MQDNTISIILFVAITALFLFACKGDGNQGNKTFAQVDQSKSSSMLDNDIREDTAEEIIDTEKKTVMSERREVNANQPPNRYTDENGQPRYSSTDINGRIHTLDYPNVEVKPLYNGKNTNEEFFKYVRETNKFSEIAKENNIQNGRIFYQFIIDVDGTVVDAEIKESPHPLLSAEMLRIINDSQGKWTPGKQDGNTIKVKIIAIGRF